jgi:putative ABC transport system permease protein
MKFLGLVLKNLFRNKRRTALTVFSIAVSLFIFSALVSLPTVANEILADSASSVRVITHNKAGLAYNIPYAYRQKIAITPHVVAVVPESWFGGVLHDVNDQFPNLAIDDEQAEEMWPDWGITPAEWEQFRKIRTACLVGPDTMKRFHLHIGQQIVLKGTLYPFNVTLNIVGVLGSKSPPSLLYFRRDYLEEAAGRPGMVDSMWVRVDNGANVPQVIASLDEQFANSSAETQSESEAAFLGSFMKNYRMIFNMAEILGVIVVITIGLVAANTSAMSIRERRGEIAVMRSMGFPSGMILSLLLAESFVIGLVGGLVGCSAAYVLLKVFVGSTDAMGPFASLRMPLSVLIETLCAAAVIGLASAWVPARAASRMSIVDALRMVA